MAGVMCSRNELIGGTLHLHIRLHCRVDPFYPNVDQAWRRSEPSVELVVR